MKIAIFGIGFLGSKLMEFFSKEHKVIGVDINSKNKNIKKLDATNKKEVEDFLFSEKPEIVINTIALTSSVACEKNPVLCKKLNFETAKNIADACKKINAKIVFISSSYVFDGKKGNYGEEDLPKAINEYGKTKSMAEKEILKLNDSIILRADLLYGYNGKGEENGLVGMILQGGNIKVRESNQLRTPILIDDFAEAILELIKKNEKGIFNLSNSGEISKYDFFQKIKKGLMNGNAVIFSKDNNQSKVVNVPRCPTLNNSKIRKLGIKIHSFSESFQIISNQIRDTI